MKIKREFTGVWIPRDIWEDENLKWMEKLLLAEVHNLEGKKGCTASNAHFAGFFKLSNSRVSQIINRLVKKKYLIAKYIREGKEIKKRILRTRKDVFNILNTYLEYCEESNIVNISKDILTDGPNNGPLSHNKKKKKKSTFSPNKHEVKLIEYWNTLPNVSKHYPTYKRKGKEVESDTYMQCCKMIRRLRMGTSHRLFKLDPTYQKKNNISDSLLKQKLSNDEIKEGMDRLALLFVEGYWPIDKNKLQKRLPDLIYSSYRGTSFFFKVLIAKPKKLNTAPRGIPKDKDLYAEYERIFADHLVGVKEKEKLILMTNEIQKFFKRKAKRVFKKDSYWGRYFDKSINPLVKEHIRWLGKKKEVYFSYLDIEHVMFNNFLIYLKKLHKGEWNFLDERKKKDYEEFDDFAKIKQHIF